MDQLTRDLLYDYDRRTVEPVKENLICPVCGSIDIEDVSSYASNGIYGPGCASWKTFDCRCCRDCGVLFKPVKKKLEV
jgi:hypothetical protein